MPPNAPWMYGLMGARGRGGLMGEEPDPSSQPSPSFWERLSKIWAGRPDPRLNQEQEKQVRDDALMAAGLQMLMGSNDPYGNPRLMSLLAQSAATGQAYAGGQRQQMVEQNRRAQLMEAVQSGQVDEDSLNQLFVEALATGDIDSARVLSEVIKSRRGGAGGLHTVQTPTETIVLDGQGNELRRYPKTANLERVDVGDALVWLDEQGNEVRRVAKHAAPGMEAQRDNTQANQLMGRYLQQTADDRKVADLYGTVVAASRDPSAAGDLSLIFAYMKVLDPGSVVREGEFANAQNTGSVPQRVWAQYNKVLRGERLTDAQRNDFMKQAEAIARQRSDKLSKVIEWYRRIAGQRGLNPDDVAFNYYDIYFPQVGQPTSGGSPPQPTGGGVGPAPTGGVLDQYIGRQ